MQDLSQRGLRHRAFVLPMQMQRQHQVCPPGLSDGMALTLQQEVLRALQDAFPFHQAV